MIQEEKSKKLTKKTSALMKKIGASCSAIGVSSQASLGSAQSEPHGAATCADVGRAAAGQQKGAHPATARLA